CLSSSARFPYTTIFRSCGTGDGRGRHGDDHQQRERVRVGEPEVRLRCVRPGGVGGRGRDGDQRRRPDRRVLGRCGDRRGGIVVRGRRQRDHLISVVRRGGEGRDDVGTPR